MGERSVLDFFLTMGGVAWGEARREKTHFLIRVPNTVRRYQDASEGRVCASVTIGEKGEK